MSLSTHCSNYPTSAARASNERTAQAGFARLAPSSAWLTEGDPATFCISSPPTRPAWPVSDDPRFLQIGARRRLGEARWVHGAAVMARHQLSGLFCGSD